MNIDALVDELQPVRRLRPWSGFMLTCSFCIAASAGVALTSGLRPDIVAGNPHPLVVVRTGLLLLLGFASLHAVTGSALPGVGRRNIGWQWALAAAAVVPAASLILSISAGTFPQSDLHSPLARWCIGISLGSGLLIGGMLTFWLRAGAPTSAARSGWLVGLTAGAFGAFAYGLHCPSNSIHYVGLWYTLAVGLCAGLGRLIVPRFIRW